MWKQQCWKKKTTTKKKFTFNVQKQSRSMLANKPVWNRSSQCVTAKIPKHFVWIQLSGFNTPQRRATRARSRWDTYTWRSFLKCFKSVGIVPRRMFLADLYCYGRFFENETGSWTIEETVTTVRTYLCNSHEKFLVKISVNLGERTFLRPLRSGDCIILS